MRHTAPARRKTTPQSFRECLSYFLTPSVWRQAHQTRGAPSQKIRWSLQPLVLALLAMTWCTGDSQEERFQTAQAFCVACRPKAKQPGKTLQGFHKALARLPMPVLRALAAGMRRGILLMLGKWLTIAGYIPYGCDGSRLECPRERELEERLGQAGKPDSAPTMYLTALVHLASGLLWAWQIGKGTASEHFHLICLLRTLPANALIVADAAYLGYDLYQAILDQRLSFLVRMSSRASLYTPEWKRLKRFREGIVYYWPKCVRKRKLPPLKLRLLRISGGKVDVWLLTNVLDGRRLSRKTAAQLYRWRWRNEGFFRTYKRTLGKVKLRSRTVALLHREAEGSLLAVQILLAHGALALSEGRDAVVLASPRRVLLVMRQEILKQIHQYLGRRQQESYLQRLQHARLETRQRTSPKAARDWPRRKPHRPPKPPKLRAMPKTLLTYLRRNSTAA